MASISDHYIRLFFLWAAKFFRRTDRKLSAKSWQTLVCTVCAVCAISSAHFTTSFRMVKTE
jgi:hypothetical protein